MESHLIPILSKYQLYHTLKELVIKIMKTLYSCSINI